MDIGGAVKGGKKYAGLPVWAWGVIIIVALLVAVFRKSSGGTVAPPKVETEAPVAVDPTASSIPRPTSPASLYNSEWARKAESFLTAQGYPVYTSRNAINKYLQGKPITGADASYLAMAKTAVGAPPEPLGSPTTPPKEWSPW